MLVKRLAKAASVALTLRRLSGGGPDDSLGDLFGADAPVPPALVKEMKTRKMALTAPILVRLFKEESQLEVWKQTGSGSYALLKTYAICAWSGKLGPKKTAGDRQAPEGFYTVTPGQMNPSSQHHLAFNIGYPNVYDRANGRSGEHLMVHGSCNSSGCYAMDDWQVEELYALARDAFKGGQRSFQIQAMPFRMTPQNMARHRKSDNYAFWTMLKAGYDRFELAKQPVEVGVCEKRYIFDAKLPDGQRLSPTGRCPSVEEPGAVAAKRIADEAEEEKLIAAMSPSDFATTSTFTYKTGTPITADAYAAEQHRRAGFDRLGKPLPPKKTATTIFDGFSR